MRHRRGPYIAVAAALIVAAPADARTLTIRQPGAPELTFTVPPGWRADERPREVVLTSRRRRISLVQCPLRRAERDMSGRHAAHVLGQYTDATIPARGGSCVGLAGSDTRALVRRLRPFLGRPGPVPASDGAAERLARTARQRTLAMARAEGSAFAIPHGADVRIEGTWAWDLPSRYQYRRLQFGTLVGEVVRDRTGDYVRDEFPCWGGTSPAEQDDAFEPRLELQEWNAPPATTTAWRVAYAPAEPQPDGSTLVRWTGFVADGEAVIAPDGRLARVRIEDHGQAEGRTAWRTVEIAFIGFPAAITPVRPEPRC